MAPDRKLCAKCRAAAPVTVDLRAIATAVGPRDPYPLETSSADRVLSNPCTEEETHDRRQRERGLVRVVCAGCQGAAWREPPCWVNGVERVVVRCRACASQRKCVACGVRAPRHKRDHCAPCFWREKQEGVTEEMPTTTASGKATKTCPYCKKNFETARTLQICCGSEKCKEAHRNYLFKNPRHKQAPPVDPAAVLERAKPDLQEWEKKQAPPPAAEAPVSQPDSGPVLCGSPDHKGLPVAPAQVHNPHHIASSDANARREGEEQLAAPGLDRRAPAVSSRPPASGEHMAGPLGVRFCPICKMEQIEPGEERCGMCAPTPPEVAAFAQGPSLEQAEQVVARSWGLTREQLDAHLDRTTQDPIMVAVLALEALPAGKVEGVLALMAARATIARAEQEAEELLASLRAS